MAQPHLKKWTIDEFFLWQERQGSRFELVDGFPHKLMKGARNVHNDIGINVLSELRNQLRTSGCYPFPGECSVETLPGKFAGQILAWNAVRVTQMPILPKIRA